MMGRRSLAIFCLVSLFLFISAIYIDEDCLARQKYESTQDWTQSHIRAWANGTKHSSFINITLEFDPEGYPETFDVIEIWRDQIEIRRVRENNQKSPKKIKLDHTLNSGWVELIFVSGEEFVFNFPKNPNVSVQCEGEKERLRKITVEGSIITVNCMKDIMYWIIDHTSEIIPLELNISNKFSVFSRKEYLPTVNVGEKELQLGCNDGIMDDVSSFKDKLQVPLAGHQEYLFTIGCINDNCKAVLGGKGEGQVTNVPPSSSMRISTRGGESFSLILHLEPETVKTTEARTLMPIKGPTNDNDTIFTVVIISLSIVLVVGIIVFASVLRKFEKDKEQSSKNSSSVFYEDERRLLEPTLTRHSSMSSYSPMGTRLWDAVVQSNIELVRFLLKEGFNPANKEDNTPTTPLQEAHMLGDKKITTIFQDHLKRDMTKASEEIINFTLETLEKRLLEVFAAAKYGQYERINGVSVLLKSHCLPGTIRNTNGWSLVHYIAAARFSDERPAWEPTDIRNFFNEQKHYINAIDHWGNTAVHVVATQKGNRKIVWNGQEVEAKDAWMDMAKILVEYGCDPRIPNHQNLLPHERARNCGNHEMAEYLKDISKSKGSINHEASADKYEELLKAVKKNDITKITSLLNEHVPMLPMFAQEDLLAEALRTNHAETVFLLLCAGVPLCNISIDALTPLEVAHNTIGLPALFPALMRKVYADKLKDEMNKIVSNDDIQQKMKKAMETMLRDILNNGCNSKWKFESDNKKDQNTEAKKILCVASSLGLSLTIQLLALQDVELHSLPDEENPINNAQSGNHIDTLYTLIRDLKLAPYTISDLEKFTEKIKLDFWISEYVIFKRAIFENQNQLLLEVDKEKINMYLDKIKKMKSSISEEIIDSKFLYMVSQCGLVHILHQLSQKKKIDFNQVIQPFSGTMLHISSHYGNLNLTEYLLYHGADPSLKTKGNFTAAHIAGIAGQKETMNYLLAYMKHFKMEDEECILGTTAEILFNLNFDVHQKFNSNFQIMNTENAFHVKNEVGLEDKTYQILKNKGEVLNIKYKNDLSKAINKVQTEYNSLKSNQAEDVEKELKLIVDKLKGTPFEGTLKVYGALYEGDLVFSNDELNFLLELSNFSARTENSNISVTQEEEGKMIFSIKSEKEKTLFQGRNFMKKYIETITNIVENYTPSSTHLCLAPPFLIPYKKGVSLLWAWYSENTFRKVRTFIEPAIKADWPSKDGIKKLPEDKQKLCTSEDYIILHLHNIDGLWSYRASNFVREIFKTLTENEKGIWVICRLIILLIENPWWSPNTYGRQSANRSDAWSVGVETLSYRSLRTLYLTELTKAPSNKWCKEDAYERVLHIFKNAVEEDENGNLKVIEELAPVTLPQTPEKTHFPSVLGIIRYLEGLRSESPKVARNPFKSQVSFIQQKKEDSCC